MADFTKLVRSLTSASHDKPSRLKKTVGLPFWIGMAVSAAVAFHNFQILFPNVHIGFIIIGTIFAALIGGVLVQAIFDLGRGIKSGEVQKRYLAALGCIVFIAFLFGVIYYRTPESGFERMFSMATLVIISAMFGYIVGRAKP